MPFMNRRRWLLGIPLVVIGLVLWGGILWCVPINGKIIDAATGQPIPDVIVLFEYRGDWLHLGEPASVCVHVESAVTDSNGKYHMPAWIGGWSVENLQVTGAVPPFTQTELAVYKRNYVPSNQPGVNAYPLARFTGTHEERFKYLLGRTTRYCDLGGRSRKNYLPLMRAAYEEAESIAATPTEIWWLNEMRKNIERNSGMNGAL